MDDKAAVLADVCAALSGNQLEEAGAILRNRYPFVPLINVRRRYSVRQMLTAFVRDGFIDRYCGARLVCVAALRLISNTRPIPVSNQLAYGRLSFRLLGTRTYA
jgi:hypothetical protein